MQNNTSTKFEGGDKYIKWVSMVHEKKKKSWAFLSEMCFLIDLIEGFCSISGKKLRLASINL